MTDMKKGLLSVCLLLVVVLLTACGSASETKNATISLGPSQKFSKAEVQAAADCALKRFKSYRGCKLQKLWYDEKSSDMYVTSHLGPKDDLAGASESNAIVLYANFSTGPSSSDDGFNPNDEYEGWSFILARDSAKSNWKVVSNGFG